MYGGYSHKNRIQVKNKQRKSAQAFLGHHIVFILLVSVGGFFLVVFAPLFRITSVSVLGSQVVAQEHILDTTTKEIESKRFLVLPNDSTLLLPKDGISNTLLAAYPRLDSVVIDRSGLHEARVEVIEREPVYTYCEQDACTLVDKHGFAFETTMSRNDTLITLEGDRAQFLNVKNTEVASDTSVSIPTQLLDESIFSDIDTLKTGFARFGFTTSNISLHKGRYIDFLTSYNSLGAIRLSVRSGDSIDKTLSNLETVLQSSSLKEALAKDPNSVEYIILYTGNKVIFKLKNTEPQTKR